MHVGVQPPDISSEIAGDVSAAPTAPSASSRAVRPPTRVAVPRVPMTVGAARTGRSGGARRRGNGTVRIGAHVGDGGDRRRRARCKVERGAIGAVVRGDDDHARARTRTP